MPDPPPRRHSLAKSFRFALRGVALALPGRCMRVHLAVSCVALVGGWVLRLTAGEWVSVALAIGMVMALEIANTALEQLADAVTLENHPLIRDAKDLGAGAVLIGAVASVVVAAIVFGPKIWCLACR